MSRQPLSVCGACASRALEFEDREEKKVTQGFFFHVVENTVHLFGWMEILSGWCVRCEPAVIPSGEMKALASVWKKGNKNKFVRYMYVNYVLIHQL